MTVDITQPHLHVWTRTLDGCEFANSVYGHDVDASLAFIGVARQITKYNPDADIKIEDVYNSLQDGGRGMYAGVPGFVVVVSRCEGGCHSPTWN